LHSSNGVERIFRNDKTVPAFNVLDKFMKQLFPQVLAVVLSIACFVPAPASAYYYRGRYYRYRYGSHYYRYYHGGHYYLHRRWVAGAYGRPGYYRYW